MHHNIDKNKDDLLQPAGKPRFAPDERLERLAKVNKLTDKSGEIRNYLAEYDQPIYEFSEKVRSFLSNAMEHSDRLAYRDAIAASHGLDISSAKAQDLLWAKILDEGNPYRGHVVKWKSGQDDMSLEELRNYMAFCLKAKTFTEPRFAGLVTVTRYAIRRTLIYIRVFPPKSPKTRKADLRFGDDLPEGIESCWRQLRKHACYRNNHGDLNQHAMDTIVPYYANTVWQGPGSIGDLKRNLENDPIDSAAAEWFWPFLIFQHATTCKIESRNHHTLNIYRNLWDPQHRLFPEVWA